MWIASFFYFLQSYQMLFEELLCGIREDSVGRLWLKIKEIFLFSESGLATSKMLYGLAMTAFFEKHKVCSEQRPKYD